MASNMVYPASATFLYEAGDRHQSLTRGQRAFRKALLRQGNPVVGAKRSGWGGVLLTKGKSAT